MSLPAMSLPTLPQVVAWVTLVLLLSALLYGAALLLERLARGVAPARAIWGGAIALLLGLAVAAPLRQPPPAPRMPASAASAPASITLPATAPRATAWTRLAEARAWTGTPISAVTQGASRVVARLDATHQLGALVPWLLAAWGVASLAVLAAYTGAYRRLRRAIRSGQAATVAGVPVVVTETIGPLVAGVRAPQVVVPRWLLTRAPGEQALVVAHERAHVAAHDPQLLLAGALGVVLLPWNPFCWGFLARLRLAIEVDCDHRLLRSGAPAARYGRLLIDLSAPHPVLSITAPAFSHHTSHLERRLRTMTAPASLHPRVRQMALAAVGALSVLTACESQLPTAAEVEQMDVAALEARTAAGLPGAANGPTYFFVDGRQLTEAEAKALPAGKIAAIQVVKTATGAGAVREVRITTGGDSTRVVRGMPLDVRRLDSGAVAAVRISGVTMDSTVFVVSDSAVLHLERNDASTSGTPLQTLKVGLGRRAGADTSAAFVIRQNGTAAGPSAQPLLIVDGVRQPQEALKRLAPDAIQSIEVIKGPAASRQYGPDGANGVIVVTTKGKK
jgi:TonB-dependent SusC/RagA subfamily outer membrane receptor